MSRGSVTDGNPGGPTSTLSPYITCSSESWESSAGPLRERIAHSGGGGGGGGGGAGGAGGGQQGQNHHSESGKGGSAEVLQALCNKLYRLNEKVLNASALCKHPSSFLKCLQSIQRPLDMREFVGGMSKFQVRTLYHLSPPNPARLTGALLDYRTCVTRCRPCRPRGAWTSPRPASPPCAPTTAGVGMTRWTPCSWSQAGRARYAHTRPTRYRQGSV